MAFVTKQVSDLSGTEANAAEFVVVTVREHPELDAPVQLDVLPDEIADLKESGEVVVVEVKTNGGDARQLVVTLDAFNALADDMSKVLSNARPTRGRRPRVTA